ncbi:MAG: hypothetical protein ACXV7I_07570 [Ilumatobacteraceae bacterium]
MFRLSGVVSPQSGHRGIAVIAVIAVGCRADIDAATTRALGRHSGGSVGGAEQR